LPQKNNAKTNYKSLLNEPNRSSFLGRGGGLVVSDPAHISEDPSLNKR